MRRLLAIVAGSVVPKMLMQGEVDPAGPSLRGRDGPEIERPIHHVGSIYSVSSSVACPGAVRDLRDPGLANIRTEDDGETLPCLAGRLCWGAE